MSIKRKYNAITADYGWLSPEGKFYPCNPMGHAALAARLGFAETALEDLGWVKVQYNSFSGNMFFAHTAEITQKQRDLIFDYCAAPKTQQSKRAKLAT